MGNALVDTVGVVQVVGGGTVALRAGSNAFGGLVHGSVVGAGNCDTVGLAVDITGSAYEQYC